MFSTRFQHTDFYHQLGTQNGVFIPTKSGRTCDDQALKFAIQWAALVSEKKELECKFIIRNSMRALI